MMAAPSNAFEVRRDIGRPALTVIERIALECLKQIAREGREATQEEIRAGIGSDNQCGSTATSVINRLVAKGYVARIGLPLQKAMWLRICETGEATAEPRDKTTHHRYRTDRVPAPAIQPVREKMPDIAAMIEREARRSNRPLAAFLADLVYIGWHEYRAEQELGE